VCCWTAENVKIFFSLYRYKMRKIKMAKAQMMFKLAVTIIMDDLEEYVKFDR